MQGTPQDQIQSPPEYAPEGASTIAMPTVDADQLPREKGWTYDDISRIVGSLYLDSHHAMQVREEQFQGMVDEYERDVLRAQAELKGKQGEVDRLVKEVGNLRRELEIRNGHTKSRTSTPPSSDRDDAMLGSQ